MVLYLQSERTTTKETTMIANSPNRMGNKDSGISISIHLDSSIVFSFNNFFVPAYFFSRVFFILIVEKKKNSDELLLGGYGNEI
jgi:hypothetical protein